MSTLITLPRKVFTLAAERSGDLSTNNLYYCGVNGASRSLYKMNLNTTTETVLTMPVSKMICADTGDIIVSDSRDSILFNFVQNGLHGVGEIINP
jgi:hypothetical protein